MNIVIKIISKFFDIFLFISMGSIRFSRYKGVKIGNNCRIYIKDWGSEPFLIKIGNKVTVTSGVRFITHDGSTWLVHNANGERYQKYGRIEVGNNVFIGVNSIILPGVSICDNVVIGAGTIINKNINSDGVYVGSPARRIMSFHDYCEKIKSTCVDNDELSTCGNYIDRVNRAVELQDEKQK
ncbi:acyltransferase [Photobacterium leiognathi]|uniref:acyltransferase n=1 Tax=Photobacterium leiognathi TaxID=553611 RepID=UPI000D1744F1|nr:acyltransferase [Photobacterium leiognathi]PSW57452.1 acyltransferase [Photobacterium leiognathi subsp. mandapamensis]